MAALLTDQASDTTGSGASHSGACSVHVAGEFDGATVHLEAAPTDTADDYVPCGVLSQLRSEGWINVDISGSYYLRAKLARSGSDTSVTVTSVQ